MAPLSPPLCATAGLTGGWKDQCSSQGAPSSIQRRSTARSDSVRDLPDRSGGMRSSSNSGAIRYSSSLSSTFPATTAWPPVESAAVIPSRESTRRPASRVSGSGPWHWKHLSERIGRTSRAKSTGALSSTRSSGPAEPAGHAVRARTVKARVALMGSSLCPE